jgi:7-keto-8-aminopelargonate synthetase-like enzyme
VSPAVAQTIPLQFQTDSVEQLCDSNHSCVWKTRALRPENVVGDASQRLEFIQTVMSEGAARGIAHRAAEDIRLDGRGVTLNGRLLVNFASCSYLGLEVDPRLKAAVVAAVDRFGTQFSSSRSFISAPPYEQLEDLLGRLTGGTVLVTPNTTLAHLSALPVLVGEQDAVILDHQVHHSVQLAVPQLRQQGTRVEFVRHQRIDLLEKLIRDLKDSHRHIWYLADGVYSMYGDLAAIEAMSWLVSEYEQLHLYIDDAHGMSWRGRHGRGYALEELTRRERCVVATSLNKAFGAGGGALVFEDSDQYRKVRHCGGPMIFTGPIQPPILAAGIASAEIHLSDEIEGLQAELRERVIYTNRLAAELDLPLANSCEVPIRFIAIGKFAIACEMAEHLLERGLLLNAAVFPAVPAKRCGLRFTVTRHHRLSDIRRLLETVAEHLPKVLAKHGSSRDEIAHTFRLGPRRPDHGATPVSEAAAPVCVAEPKPRCLHETTIEAFSREEWDRCLGGRGSFSWEGLRYLESVFDSDAAAEQDRWRFHYYMVRDEVGDPVLATFFTDALWKDDMLSEASVSRRVESHRVTKPTFLTSRVFSMGSLLTEGNHLYLNREASWQPAVASLLDQVAVHSEACGAASVVLRDLDSDDEELDRILRDASYSTIACPDAMVLDVTWSDWDEFLSRLSARARRFQKRYVTPRDGAFAVEVLRRGSRLPSDAELAHLYRLYRNVKERNLELNTFALPESFLPRMLEHPGWEIVTLTLKPDKKQAGGMPHAFVAAYVGPEQYVPVVVGLDYRAVGSHGSYRQCIRQVIRRAESHRSSRILLGMGAELEKERFGAQRVKRSFYVQSRDHYQHDVLSLLAMDATS